MSSFHTPPPNPSTALLTFPNPHILLVTLNRPAALNSITSTGNAELHDVWEWMDDEPRLRVGILTGKGRAFCAGADLKEWNAQNTTTTTTTSTHSKHTSSPNPKPTFSTSGFGGISRRSGKKPIICAVNGLCLGGGSEIAINADLVIASRGAYFGFPEVARGVVAIAGALPRVVRTIGKQRAMEMVLTGRRVGAEEGEKWGFVNEVVDGDVLVRAVQVARVIAEQSPDAVVVSREGVKMGWEGIGAEEGSRLLVENWGKRLYAGENMKEGVRAFVEKRKPRWVASKL